MSCCGNKRAAYAQQQSANTTRRTVNNPGLAPAGASHNVLPPKMWADLHFESISDRALTVIGPVTGRRYRWTAKGDVQIVDYRDAGGLRPHLHSLKRLK
jgi:hypothetical protein